MTRRQVELAIANELLIASSKIRIWEDTNQLPPGEYERLMLSGIARIQQRLFRIVDKWNKE